MTTTQLSVFLENKSGRLTQIMNILGQSDIRIIAATVADTSEYGILRLITTNPAEALEVLRRNNISANLNEVFVLTTCSDAGSFAKELLYFSEAQIGIEYMYSFSIQGKAFLILRTNNIEQSKACIIKNNLHVLDQAALNEQ